MPRKNVQLSLLSNQKKSFGGELMKTRRGRVGSRPLTTRNTMHLVLRSSKARGEWSMVKPKNRRAIGEIANRFSKKYGIRILSLANVGNHLHFHIQLTNLFTYTPFIRAVTAAIAMAVTGRNRWTIDESQDSEKLRFWDYRPFTRVIAGGFKAFLTVRDYVKINKLEGFGFKREVAEIIVREESSA